MAGIAAGLAVILLVSLYGIMLWKQPSTKETEENKSNGEV